MKTFVLHCCFLFLLVILPVTGCKKETNPDCYKGKVVSLNNGDGCNNILEIIECPDGAELSIGSTTTFDPTLAISKINKGDLISFKIIQYNKWTGPANAACLWPEFTAQIEFCNNNK